MSNEYERIEHILKRILKLYIPETVLVTKKWSNEDYVYPFSDIDYRLVVKDGVDLYEINERLYEAHFRCVSEISLGARILEHPPGYIYFQSELELLKVDRDVFCRDSYSSGNKQLFDDTYERIDKSLWNPYSIWTSFQQRFNKFALKYEFKFFDDELRRIYEKYCAIWHYYLPCVYFINVLRNEHTYNRKINNEWYNERFLALIDDFRNNREPRESIDELIKLIDEELMAISKHTMLISSGYTRKDNDDALFMLRTRIARIRYYMNPPASCDTFYLQERECKELVRIFSWFYKREENEIWRKLLSILNMSCVNATSKLQEVMRILCSEKNYMLGIMNGEIVE